MGWRKYILIAKESTDELYEDTVGGEIMSFERVEIDHEIMFCTIIFEFGYEELNKLISGYITKYNLTVCDKLSDDDILDRINSRGYILYEDKLFLEQNEFDRDNDL